MAVALRFSLFAPHPLSIDSLDRLPAELQLAIFQRLDLPSLLRLGQVDRFRHAAASDNNAWAALYQRDFGPMPDRNDAQAQYMAAWLYRQASACPRRDLAHIHFMRCLNFLDAHRTKPWAQYYLGCMQYHGRGTKIDRESGLNALLRAAYANDYRAAIELVTIILTHGNYRNLMARHGDSLIACLESAYRNGIRSAALQLAYLHSNHEGAAAKPDTVETWLLCAMDAGDIEAVRTYVELKADDVNMSMFLEFEKLNTRYKNNRAMLAEIAWQHGCYYEQLDDFPMEASLRKTTDAAKLGHLQARHKLASSCYQRGLISFRRDTKIARLEEAVAFLKDGFRVHHADSTMLLFEVLCSLNKVSKTGNADTLKLFKQAFRNGNSTAAKLVYDYYLHSDMNPLYQPEVLLWRQCSILCGNVDDLRGLANSADNSAYAACTLGLIYFFGVPGSSLRPNTAAAAEIFRRANNLDPHAIERYLQTGVKEGILCKEAQALLKHHLPVAKNDNACAVM